MICYPRLFTDFALAAAAVLSGLALPASVVAKDNGQLAQPTTIEYFETYVLPVFKEHCLKCHSHQAGKSEGGLMLDSRSGWKTGGDSGPAIVPGKPDKSRLIRAVECADETLQMPPEGKIPVESIQILRRWIQAGAVDPRVSAPAANSLTSSADGPDPLWWMQSTQLPAVPTPDDLSWPSNAIDHFVLARLEHQGLKPADPADRYTLLRRLSFDLTGLPPTLEEIEAFISDPSPVAYQRVVDRLLASPHFGERWGRHWLDVARYADSNGADINYAHANAWRYRDYVIRSFNSDKPYDQFVIEQLAGDLLPPDGSESERNDRITATGFLLMGPKMLAEVDTDKLLIDVVDEQLDIAGRTLLGLTFGCARCHDHKFDPITARDYYALAGIFRSTRSIKSLRNVKTKVSEWYERELLSKAQSEQKAESRNRLKRLEQRLAELGVAPEPESVDSNRATRAALAEELPQLRSTTWLAWVRLHSRRPNLDAVISADYAGANQGHSLGFHSGQSAYHPRIVWNHGTGRHTIIMSADPIAPDQWHQLGLTFESQSGILRLFVDGQLQARADHVEGTPFSVVAVGRREASQQFGLVGSVDDVVVYDRALSEREITAAYEREAPSAGQVLRWTFEDVPGGRILDQTDNGQHGRLTGFLAADQVLQPGRTGKALTFRLRESGSVRTDSETAEIERIREQWRRLRAQDRPLPQVMAVAKDKPRDLPILIRGNHLQPGDSLVQRATPEFLSPFLPRVQIAAQRNGRLELARWIVDPRHPLTARVMVNRIWQHLHGEGIVRTPSNFGTRGAAPSHPQLLDWLANEFIASGWSIKHIVRLIATSQTYRMSSQASRAATERDPSNRLLWRHTIRRLEAEPIRDSLFAVSGQLDLRMGGSLMTSPNLKRVELEPDSPVYESNRRAVYLPAIRVRGNEMFTIFDVPSSGQHVAQRSATTVPQQALFFLNNPLVVQRADSLATRALGWRLPTETATLRRLYLTVYGRPPAAEEVLASKARLRHLREFSPVPGRDRDFNAWAGLCHVLIASNEFVFVR